MSRVVIGWPDALGEKVSWYCAAMMATMLILSCFAEWGTTESEAAVAEMNDEQMIMTTRVVPPFERRCEEIYIVREGETLQTISEKCGDPFIVEENPHIHDPDDVFPGLVIKITPFIYT